MIPGASPRDVLESLRDAAALWIRENAGARVTLHPPARDSTLSNQLARHAASVLRAGGTPPDALDSALVRLLYTGESEAVREDPTPDPDLDPVGVRPLADLMRDYPSQLVADAPERPACLHNRSSNVQLMITRRCQLRCAYCPVVKGDEDMPREVIDHVLNLLLGSSRSSVRIDFSGGEPLLRWDEVQRASVRAIAAGEALLKKVGFYMVTNGFELTPSRAEELASYGFRVELSLDGSEEAHNRYKIPVDRSDNPYRRTIQAIENAIDARLAHTVVMVVTPDTVRDLRESFEHAVGLGVGSIDVNYAIGRTWDEESIQIYLSTLTSIVEDHAVRLHSGDLELGNLTSRVEPAVLNAEWMVNTDGSVHLMTEWALESSRPSSSEDLSFGHISTIGSWDGLYAGRFHSYDALLRTYAWRDAGLRALLHNNVRTGRKVARHVEKLKSVLG
jgi:sulfatase maturation enzyme AslB (radical SAM superfamily)